MEHVCRFPNDLDKLGSSVRCFDAMAILACYFELTARRSANHSAPFSCLGRLHLSNGQVHGSFRAIS
jgi:hypothetical protein